MAQTSKNYLGIDYGAKRIGLAVGNTDSKLARPLEALTTEPNGYRQRLAEILLEQSIDELVVGLPRSLDGDETAQTNEVRVFARELAGFKLPIHFQDEAGTSSLARERAGSKALKEAIDAEAAAIILQDFLDEYDKA
jgi:putative holliday junction resolvase